MVGSSVTPEERSRAALLFKIGLTLLVGISAGLVSLQVGASLEFTLAAMAVGTVLGAGMTWLLVRNLRQMLPDGVEERRNRER